MCVYEFASVIHIHSLSITLCVCVCVWAGNQSVFFLFVLIIHRRLSWNTHKAYSVCVSCIQSNRQRRFSCLYNCHLMLLLYVRITGLDPPVIVICLLCASVRVCVWACTTLHSIYSFATLATSTLKIVRLHPSFMGAWQDSHEQNSHESFGLPELARPTFSLSLPHQVFWVDATDSEKWFYLKQ